MYDWKYCSGDGYGSLCVRRNRTSAGKIKALRGGPRVTGDLRTGSKTRWEGSNQNQKVNAGDGGVIEFTLSL